MTFCPKCGGNDLFGCRNTCPDVKTATDKETTMQTYFIPAMLLVKGEDEDDAARRINALLGEHGDGPVLEKHVLPNHQAAIGAADNDEGQRLVFVENDLAIWYLQGSILRGWKPDAYKAALDRADVDLVSIHHPTNWMTESEAEAFLALPVEARRSATSFILGA